jgi:hypothetical protein
MKKLNLLCYLAIFISACSPIINTQIKKSYPPNPNDSIIVYDLGQNIEYKYEDLGTFKIENGDFTKLSKYDKIIDYAKNEAKKIGGNAIKILEHIKPETEMAGLGVVFTTSHNVVFKVIKVSDVKNKAVNQLKDSTLLNKDAHLYFYEQKNAFAGHYNRTDFIESMALNMGYGYQILLDDSLILKLGKKWQKSMVQTHKFGNHRLTAKIKQGTFNIPFNIEEGKDYYIRFKYSISGRRTFEIVENELGEFEYSIVK